MGGRDLTEKGVQYLRFAQNKAGRLYLSLKYHYSISGQCSHYIHTLKTPENWGLFINIGDVMLQLTLISTFERN